MNNQQVKPSNQNQAQQNTQQVKMNSQAQHNNQAQKKKQEQKKKKKQKKKQQKKKQAQQKKPTQETFGKRHSLILMYFYMLIERMSVIRPYFTAHLNKGGQSTMSMVDMRKALNSQNEFINGIKQWDDPQRDVFHIIAHIVRDVSRKIHAPDSTIRDPEAKSFAKAILSAINNNNNNNKNDKNDKNKKGQQLNHNVIRKELVFHLIRDMQHIVRLDVDANKADNGYKRFKSQDRHEDFTGHYYRALQLAGVEPEMFSDIIENKLPYIGDLTTVIRKAKVFKCIYRAYSGALAGTDSKNQIEAVLKCINVKNATMRGINTSSGEHDQMKLMFLNRLSSFVNRGGKYALPQFEDKVVFTVNYDELYEQRSTLTAEAKWKTFIGRDIERALNLELDVGCFDYTHLFDNLHQKLKLRKQWRKIHESDSHSIRERSERIDAILKELPILLKLPDAFCCVHKDGNLLNYKPQAHPVYGPIYEHSMNQLFVTYGLGSRNEYLQSLHLK